MRDTTVAVILGGSDFSKAELGSDEAFKLSADALYRYLSDPDGFGLSSDNRLNLFDDPRSPSEMDVHIEEFVCSRRSALEAQKKR